MLTEILSFIKRLHFAVFFKVRKGNEGAGNYSIGITVMDLYFKCETKTSKCLNSNARRSGSKPYRPFLYEAETQTKFGTSRLF